MEKIPASLSRAQSIMDGKLFRDVNTDMNCRRFRVYGQEAAVYFVDGLCSSDFLQHYLLMPCQERADASMPTQPLLNALMLMLPLGEVEQAVDFANAIDNLMDGKAVMLAEGLRLALCFDIRAFVRRGISPPLTENVVNGPHQGFNEALRDNITLLRRMLHTPKLIGEMTEVGDSVPVNLCLLYIKDAVDEDNLQRVRNRLKAIRTDHVMSLGELEQLVEDRPFALLPQCCLTERPDRAASFLLEGQIVVVMDGAPQILAMPISFLHLFHTPDDTADRWQYGTFTRLIRLLGALCTLLLPGLFVAMVLFHPEALPVALLTSVLESQAVVPFSIPAETLIMLLMFNLINEAGTRVPGVVGNSLGTVSGLILGQAAVEANLIHPLLIIVVAVASLGSYALPDHSLTMAFRIGQLLFLAAGYAFGLYGIVLLGTVSVVRLCGMRSLGSPFAAPVSPLRTHNPDLLVRYPLWRQRLRTWLGSPHSMDRTRGRMRGWSGRK